MASDDIMRACDALAPAFSALVRSVAPVPHASLLPSSAPATGSSTALSYDSLTALYPTVAAGLQAQRTRLCALLHRTLSLSEPGRDAGPLSSLCSPLPINDSHRSAYEAVCESLDRMREAAEGYLDEARGQHSSQQVARVQQSLADAAVARERASGSGGAAAGVGGYRRMPVASANVARKPQEAFHDAPVDNSRDAPFRVKLVEKYHAVGAAGGGDLYTPTSLTPEAYADEGGHPYARELQAFAPFDWQLQRAASPAPFRALDEVEVTFVDTPAALDDLVRYLDGSSVSSDLDAAERVPQALCAGGAAPVREIAVDLEAHSMRSFQGFTCLMQLSTRSRDFIIDTLALRAHMHVLNRVFADPRVVKVLHGCDSDVLWLQRDFGIYLVNVFDTGQASRALGYPSFGLAHLLQHFAGVTANKEYQTADWRERPLPAHLLKYAREDTHYLLGIYDRVKNECIDHVPQTQRVRVVESTTRRVRDVDVPLTLAVTLARSHSKTQQQYEKEVFAPLGFRRLMAKLNLEKSALGPVGEDDVRQLLPPTTPLACAFAALYEWRDRVARAEDEAPFFILANGKLARLAEMRPGSIEELLRTLTPVPASVRKHAEELLRVLRDSAVYGSRLQAQAYAAAQAASVEAPATAASDAPPASSSAATSARAGKKRSRAEAEAAIPVVDVAAGDHEDEDMTQLARKRARPAIASCIPGAVPLSLSVSAQNTVTSVQRAGAAERVTATAGVYTRVADVWMEDDAPPRKSNGYASRVTAALQGAHIMDVLGTKSAFEQLAEDAADAAARAAAAAAAAPLPPEPVQEEVITSVAARYMNKPVHTGGAVNRGSVAERATEAANVQPFQYDAAAGAAIRETLSSIAAQRVSIPVGGGHRGRGGHAKRGGGGAARNPYANVK